MEIMETVSTNKDMAVKYIANIMAELSWGFIAFIDGRLCTRQHGCWLINGQPTYGGMRFATSKTKESYAAQFIDEWGAKFPDIDFCGAILNAKRLEV